MKGFPVPMCGIVILIGLALYLEGCGDKQSAVLAEVGDRTITVADLKWAWENWHGPRRRPLTKLDLLHVLVDKQIMVVEAYRRGLDRSPRILRELERAERERLARRWYEEKVLKEASVSEDEVRMYLGEEWPREVKVRHIMVRTKKEAEELRKALLKGADFGKLARERSLDRESAERGGDLGYWREGEVKGPTAEVAFRLGKGEISGPVRDGIGYYHIIQVVDERPVPYDEVEESIKRTLFARKHHRWREVFLGELKKEFNLRVVPETLDLLLRESRFCFDRLPRVPPKDQDRALLRYDGGKVTLRKYLEWVKMERPTRRPRPDSAHIVQFAEGMALKEFIAPEAARRMGLDRTKEVRDYLRRKMEDLMVEELRRVAVVDCVLTQGRIEKYYWEHKEEYTEPAKILVECGLLEREADAWKVFSAVRGGDDMAQVMRRYPPFDGKWPNYGVFSVLPYGERRENVRKIAEVARVHREGELVEPFKVNYRLEGKELEGYVVMRIWRRKEARLRPLDEVREDILSKLQLRYGREISERFDRFMEELRRAYASKVVFHEETLRSLR